jgi:uncharacterized YccA/Bax inhibitor family protein
MPQQSGNPTLNPRLLANFPASETGRVMTLGGTLNKIAVSLALVVLASLFTWNRYVTAYDAARVANPLHAGQAGAAAVSGFILAGVIVGLVLALVTAFKPKWSPITAPLYALAEGLFLGGVSAIFNTSYPGVVIQAVLLTFAVMAVMLFLYRSGIIKVTPRLTAGIVAATGGVFLFYLVTWVLSFFGVNSNALFFGTQLSIVISLVIVAIAAFNLLLDFETIRQGSAQGWPEYMEWYSAFALTVTLVWLYLEILRLMANLRSQ